MSNGVMDPAEFYGTLNSYRRRVGDWLAVAREGFLRAMHSDSNILTWYDQQFWVDRTRWLVLPMRAFDTPPTGTTLIDDGDGGEINENLEVLGGASRMQTSYQLLSVLGGMLAGGPSGPHGR